MALHKDKFEFMCHKFNKNRALPEFPFVSELYQYTVSAETTLEPVHQLRDLGILISSDLSWSPHIRAIAEKARQKASWVLSVFHTRSPTIMLTLYKSMVRSLVEYCCPLWHPTFFFFFFYLTLILIRTLQQPHVTHKCNGQLQEAECTIIHTRQ